MLALRIVRRQSVPVGWSVHPQLHIFPPSPQESGQPYQPTLQDESSTSEICLHLISRSTSCGVCYTVDSPQHHKALLFLRHGAATHQNPFSGQSISLFTAELSIKHTWGMPIVFVLIGCVVIPHYQQSHLVLHVSYQHSLKPKSTLFCA